MLEILANAVRQEKERKKHKGRNKTLPICRQPMWLSDTEKSQRIYQEKKFLVQKVCSKEHRIKDKLKNNNKSCSYM